MSVARQVFLFERRDLKNTEIGTFLKKLEQIPYEELSKREQELIDSYMVRGELSYATIREEADRKIISITISGPEDIFEIHMPAGVSDATAISTLQSALREYL